MRTGAAGWRRHAARLVLLLGVPGAFWMLRPALPHEQTLVFRVGDNPVQQLTASWSSADDGTPLGGVSLKVDRDTSGGIRHSISLPNGRYVLAIDIARPSHGGDVTKTSYLRRVNLGGGETTIFVEDN